MIMECFETLIPTSVAKAVVRLLGNIVILSNIFCLKIKALSVSLCE